MKEVSRLNVYIYKFNLPQARSLAMSLDKSVKEISTLSQNRLSTAIYQIIKSKESL